MRGDELMADAVLSSDHPARRVVAKPNALRRFFQRK
jgi:hypothetical protein